MEAYVANENRGFRKAVYDEPNIGVSGENVWSVWPIGVIWGGSRGA